MNKAAFGRTIWGCQAKNPNFPSNTKRVCARRFPKGPEPAAASGTGACRPLCGKKAGGTSGTTRSGESRDYVGSPEDEDRRSVGIAKEQLVATIAIPGPIGKPFGGAEVAEPQAQKSQLFLVKLLYGMFGISQTAPFVVSINRKSRGKPIKAAVRGFGRQVTLRSLTAFFLIASRWGSVGGFQSGEPA